jgi:hypothetical protein
MIPMTPEFKPLTGTGILLAVVEPLPSWPDWLSPQHQTPAFARAQANELPPTAISATFAVSPCTGTGTVLLVSEPLPRAPNTFEPQHLAALFMIAQVDVAPLAIAVTPVLKPVTATGVELSINVPLPRRPS